MSTHDETQTTNTTGTTEMSDYDYRDTTWMDYNGRGQIVCRPRRFRGLTGREGYADYVEQAYWAALNLDLLEELAALPSLEGRFMTEIADLTGSLSERIRVKMRNFHDNYAPNVFYGALTRMVEAAKEDVGRVAVLREEGMSYRQIWAALASPVSPRQTAETAAARVDEPETNTFVPALPTSPLIRQSGAGETMSDSEVELGRDVLESRASWADLSGGRPGVTGGGSFARMVSGFADKASDEEPPLPLAADGDDEEGDEDEVTGTVDDAAEDDNKEADADGDEVTGTAEADGDDDEEERIQHVPVAAAATVLHQNIGVELPLWAWLAILAAFAAWAALVNGVLSRDLGYRLTR